MDPTKEELEKIMASLSPAEWVNPYIFSYDEETRIVHTLVASKPGDSGLFYYDTDAKQFEALPPLIR